MTKMAKSINSIKCQAVRLLFFFSGIFLLALSINMIVYSSLGADPWNAFHAGLSIHTPLTLGQASQLTGFTLMFISWLLKIKPGIATILNAFFIGFFVDIVGSLGIVKAPETLLGACLLL